MGSYGGSAWILPDGGAPWILPDDGGGGGGGGSHGLCGKASYDPAASLHPPADARHRSNPYDPPAYARPLMGPDADLYWSMPVMGPDSDLFWLDPFFGRVWDDGDADSSDDPEKEPIECQICNRESNHRTLGCPFVVLTRQLDVLMRTPQAPTSQLDDVMRTPLVNVRYDYCYMEDGECIGGSGLAIYLPPGQRNVECCAADAMMLHKDGMNLVRITGLPRDVAEPELLYQLFVKIGPLTNVVVFPDHALAFVNFVSEEAAQTAIKRFTGAGFGHIMWATQKPY